MINPYEYHVNKIIEVIGEDLYREIQYDLVQLIFNHDIRTVKPKSNRWGPRLHPDDTVKWWVKQERAVKELH